MKRIKQIQFHAGSQEELLPDFLADFRIYSAIFSVSSRAAAEAKRKTDRAKI